MKGEAAKDSPERVALAQRDYDTKRYALAMRLWSEVLQTDSQLGEDRQAQRRYNAARAAALAAFGQGKDDPSPDDAAKAKRRKRKRLAAGTRRRRGRGHLAVVLDEFGNADALGQFDQPLFEPHEEVFDLGRFRLGFLGGNLADHQEMLLAVMAENEAVGAGSFLATGHWTAPMPRQCGCQIVAKSLPGQRIRGSAD